MDYQLHFFHFEAEIQGLSIGRTWVSDFSLVVYLLEFVYKNIRENLLRTAFYKRWL